MSSIPLPYLNIALDSFGLLVTLIIFFACVKEFSGKSLRTKYFLFLLASVVVTLVADIVSWIAEGRPTLSLMNVIANTFAPCMAHVAILCFMGYLKESLYESSRAANFIMKLFQVMFVFSLAYVIGNAFFGYACSVDAMGHWHCSDSISMGIIYYLFPMLAFLTIVLMAIFARSSTKVSRATFAVYTVFPVVGIILDYVIHGLSLTYVGLTVSVLVIYTNIYLKKQKLIETQRNALMISQINPHFIYNTLSTVAAMCDASPQQAKYLTLDFSRYLRRNLSNASTGDLIPFEQELEHVECYLKIEKARFRERLNVIYSIGCREFEIPPLSVQPLVENAVKHGITKKAEGGTLKISTYDTDTHYVIEVKDDGVGFDPSIPPSEDRAHVGLANVRSRIMAICKGELSVKSTPGVGTRVTIEIPKKKKRRGK